MDHNHIIQHGAIFTAQTGPWSSPSTWAGGIVPPPDSAVAIAHSVLLDMDVTTCGITIMELGTLMFHPLISHTINNCENIIVLGSLQMTPSIPDVIQTIKFHDIDESKFVGGGMDILDSDPGIWVRDTGSLTLKGSPKTPYARLQGSFGKGTKTITLSSAVTGWRIGDEIAIAPTTSPTNPTFYNGWDVRTITAISGNTITLNLSLANDHPSLPHPFKPEMLTAEVLNLTRNVRIEGKGDGTANPLTNARTHINIGMVEEPSVLSNVQLRYMGPRKIATEYTEKVLGRYALHFHHCGEVGTKVEGVVVRDSGSHAFVPHASHNITFSECISFNTFEHAYWWDAPPNNGESPENNSNNTFYSNCIAAQTKCDPSFRGYGMAGFFLGSGLNNKIKSCVAVGNQGAAGAAGFVWPESSNFTDNVWDFQECIAHNNRTDGIFVWENDNHDHIVAGFTAYRNGGYGIEHGAYANSYKYSTAYLMENKQAIFLHASAISNGVADENGYLSSFKGIKSIDGLYITAHNSAATLPILFKDCRFSKVTVNESPRKKPTPSPGLFDFVNCNLTKKDFVLTAIEEGTKIRVQDGTTAWMIDDKGAISEISPFF